MTEWQETSLGSIPKDWDITNLGELLYIKGRIGWKGLKKSEYLDEGFAIINGEQILDGKIIWERVGRITKERFDENPEIILKKNDILMTKDGTIGKTAFLDDLPEPATVASGVFVIRKDSNKLTQKYVYYFFQSHYFKYLIKSRTEGSVIPHLYQRDFTEMEVPLPETNEQKKISKLLTTLDRKINNLQRQNQTLEKIAQTLFKQWFVDFNFPDENGKPYKDSGGEMVTSELGEIPKSWNVSKLSNFGKIVCGKTPPKKNKKHYGNDIPFIKIPDMHNKVFIVETNEYLSFEGSKSQKNKLLPENSILVSCIATVGLVGINSTPSHTNQQINSIELDESFYREYLFLQLKRLKSYLLALGSGGSATLNINTSTFGSIEILSPKKKIIKEFHCRLKSVFDKILFNLKSIQTLTETRDALLPKLMSGQIRIKD